ncbi:MAG: glyoxylate/hydroxypyruvate reductase A [Hyphomicrobiaceae bacterium]
MTEKPVLLVKSAGPQSLPRWQAEFARLTPHLDIRWWDDPTIDQARVRYCIVWFPDHGRIAAMPNIEVVFSSAAGVDHIVSDPSLPHRLPIVRMVSDELAQTIGEYVTLAALMILRDQPRMAALQRARSWEYFEPVRTAVGTRVGILGLGAMGRRAAAMLSGIGFQILGWSRTAKAIPGIRTFQGDDGLARMLPDCHILIVLLPETPSTRGLIDARRLAMLPEGAGLINAARGPIVVARDVIAALDGGRLSCAILDVFDTEPLPADEPLWQHPKVMVTPHLAGYATLRAKARYVAGQIGRHEAGLGLENLYDRMRGY